jgi:hypothetical protein
MPKSARAVFGGAFVAGRVVLDGSEGPGASLPLLPGCGVTGEDHKRFSTLDNLLQMNPFPGSATYSR